MKKNKQVWRLNEDIAIRWNTVEWILEVRTGKAGDIIPVEKEGSPDIVLKNDSITSGHYGKLGHMIQKIKTTDELKKAFSENEDGDILGMMEKLDELCKSVTRDSETLNAWFTDFKLTMNEKKKVEVE